MEFAKTEDEEDKKMHLPIERVDSAGRHKSMFHPKTKHVVMDEFNNVREVQLHPRNGISQSDQLKHYQNHQKRRAGEAITQLVKQKEAKHDQVDISQNYFDFAKSGTWKDLLINP